MPRPLAGTPTTAGVRKLICGGAPGGHVAEKRLQLEQCWSAECFDRYGMTEAGPIAGECTAHPGGLHLEPRTDQPAKGGSAGQLVLTHLNRAACPIVRYRIGDLVQLNWAQRCSCGNPCALLMGGVQRATELAFPSDAAPPILESDYERQLQMAARRG